MIERQYFAYFSAFRVFQYFAYFKSNISIRKTLGRIRKSYSFSENDSKHEITLAKNLLLKESKLLMSLQVLFFYSYLKSCF